MADEFCFECRKWPPCKHSDPIVYVVGTVLGVGLFVGVVGGGAYLLGKTLGI